MVLVEILVNGIGCSSCVRAEKAIDSVIKKYEKTITVKKIDVTQDSKKLNEYGIFQVPAIIIDGVVCFEGVVSAQALDKKIGEML